MPWRMLAHLLDMKTSYWEKEMKVNYELVLDFEIWCLPGREP